MVQVVRIDSLQKTTYSVFVRNYDLTQPTELAGARFDIFNGGGFVARVEQPAPCDVARNATSRAECGTDYDFAPALDDSRVRDGGEKLFLN